MSAKPHPTRALSVDETFFFEHAGWSHGPGETSAEGRTRCAVELARAEGEARARGWWLQKEESGDEFGWQKKTFDVVGPRFKGERFTGYDCTLVDSEGTTLGSLGGVTFANNNPREPYARVIFAELATEALKNASKQTPEGLEIVSRDDDDETITVRTHDGRTVVVRNVAQAHEDRDRYNVTVDGVMAFDQLRAPEGPGPSWSSDPLGSAADAAVSFWEADRDNDRRLGLS
ncbi:MAG: hypothetical protein NVS3B16_24790 [Vulcanimicrobiaceae bacterium]